MSEKNELLKHPTYFYKSQAINHLFFNQVNSAILLSGRKTICEHVISTMLHYSFC